MENNALKPLDLKDFYSEKESSPFPYSELGETQPQPRPKPLETDRLHQLEQMLSEKKEHAARMERDAYDKAYAAGEKAGMALGRKRAEQILDHMQQALDASRSQLDEIHRAMCEAVIDISGGISEWLVGEITDGERSRLLAVAKKTALALPEMNSMTMAVHPDDFAQFEKLLAESETHSPLTVDTHVTPGCIRIFNKTQDVLIDPRTSIAEGIAHFKAELLSSAPVDHA